MPINDPRTVGRYFIASFDHAHYPFEVRLNTHSVELDQDLAAVSSLKDSKGNTFQPTGWDGSPPGGHHRSGTLTFPALPPDTEAVTLVIRGVGDTSERVFTWQVQP